MNNPIKGELMTQAEEVRELRNWLREEATKTSDMVRDLHGKIDEGNRHLHGKIDACNAENQKDHMALASAIAESATTGKVNGSKIVGLASLVSLVVSGALVVAFQVMAGG